MKQQTDASVIDHLGVWKLRAERSGSRHWRIVCWNGFLAILLVVAAGVIGPRNSLSAAQPRQGSAKPLAVGDKAINFELPVVGANDYLELKEEYSRGPVVVVVLRGYPGYQCMFCSQQLGALINRSKTLAKATSRVIVVYPGPSTQLQRHAEQFLGSRAVPPPIVLVRDPDMLTVGQWGLRWDEPRETAYPATFVINRNGRIAWSEISDTHAGRSTVTEILKELRKLQ